MIGFVIILIHCKSELPLQNKLIVILFYTFLQRACGLMDKATEFRIRRLQVRVLSCSKYFLDWAGIKLIIDRFCDYFVIPNLSQIYFCLPEIFLTNISNCFLSTKSSFEFVWIHKGYCVVKKLVWNVCIKAF